MTFDIVALTCRPELTPAVAGWLLDEFRHTRDGSSLATRLAVPAGTLSSNRTNVSSGALWARSVAAALVRSGVGIAEVADIHNVQVLDVAACVTGVAVERSTSDRVTITLRDGRTATATVGLPLGSAGNRLSMEQLTMKFVDCAVNAVRPLSDDVVHASIHMMRHLEEMPKVSDVLRHFV